MTPADYAVPRWDDVDKVHNWRNYISAEVRGLWDSFTLEQRSALARQAQEIANQEEWD